MPSDSFLRLAFVIFRARRRPDDLGDVPFVVSMVFSNALWELRSKSAIFAWTTRTALALQKFAKQRSLDSPVRGKGHFLRPRPSVRGKQPITCQQYWLRLRRMSALVLSALRRGRALCLGRDCPSSYFAPLWPNSPSISRHTPRCVCRASRG